LSPGWYVIKIAGGKAMEENYDQKMKGTFLAAAETQRDNIRDKMKDTLLEAMPKQTIPRYLRRAVWSQRPGRIHKAIGRAISEGWAKAEMVKQVKMIIGHQLENKEYEVQETT
jgi:hypothetical protein